MINEIEISYKDSLYVQSFVAHVIKCPKCDSVNHVTGAGHIYCRYCGIKFKWVEK